jgi:hypothetical protein
MSTIGILDRLIDLFDRASPLTLASSGFVGRGLG